MWISGLCLEALAFGGWHGLDNRQTVLEEAAKICTFLFMKPGLSDFFTEVDRAGDSEPLPQVGI